ncbi:TPA: uroporphyrinogen-III C-methyltransferase, partial [Candidatus Sumerlaeota bacterium]|nr:uroporphyrinogen-III C-methyltransferase [Candidatus Sumerlaeota bacterium]
MTGSPQKHPGFVSLVGAGPGDPGLITQRGLERIRQAEVIVVDHLAHPRLLQEAPTNCEIIYAGKQAGEHTLPQEKINALLVEKCQAGKHVVRLKGGDPFVFGRGGEEALALHEAGCAFEIVPGVTAGVAASAYAGIPVTHRGIASAVTFITGHEDPTKEDSAINWPALAQGNGTLVFYMGVRNLPLIAQRLIENGRPAETPVALIGWGTYPRQQTITGTLENIAQRAAGLQPPALIVVGEVVALREQLNWFEQRPLFGKRVVVTRSRAQAGELSRRLETLGADVIEFPVIRIEPPKNPKPLRLAVRETSNYQWIIFTSVNGVDAFFNALHAEGLDTRSLGHTKVCAIGPATSQALEKYGVHSDLTPPKYVAESIAETFVQQEDLTDQSVLLPRADIARSFLADALRNQGAEVEEVEAYRTVLESPNNLDAMRSDLAEGRVAAITFTSSSTVR